LNHGDVEEGRGDGSGARTGRGHDGDSTAAPADAGAGGPDAVGRANTAGVGAGRQLDPIDDAGEPEVADAEIADPVARQVIREVRSELRYWKGLAPPASELAAYNGAVENGAERILRMSEKALDSQIEVDKTLAHGDTVTVKRGQWQSTVLMGGCIAGAFTTAVLHLPWEIPVAFLAAPVFEFGAKLIRTIREH
jgi:hypothetical protein